MRSLNLANSNNLRKNSDRKPVWLWGSTTYPCIVPQLETDRQILALTNILFLFLFLYIFKFSCHYGRNGSEPLRITTIFCFSGLILLPSTTTIINHGLLGWTILMQNVRSKSSWRLGLSGWPDFGILLHSWWNLIYAYDVSQSSHTRGICNWFFFFGIRLAIS